MSNKEIGQLLSRSAKTVWIKLCHSALQRDRTWSRQHYKANPEKKKKCNRKWLNANFGYYRAHSVAYSEHHRRWRKANPEKIREAARRHNARKRAARRAALHPVTRAQIDARFALWRNRCAFCGVDANHQRNHGRERLTVEHVLALTKGGLDEAANIIPACTACNSSKNNSPVETWYRCQPFFTEARWRKVQRHCPAAASGQLPLAMV
jgi:5-methylcytosine-specific restriction endonuclease McrA